MGPYAPSRPVARGHRGGPRSDLRTELIVVANAAVVERALEAYREGRGDFADYVIREHALVAGAKEVVSFDRALRDEDGFRMIGG